MSRRDSVQGAGFAAKSAIEREVLLGFMVAGRQAFVALTST
jgi:hypothetical protein